MWRKVSIEDYNEEFIEKVTAKGSNSEDGDSAFVPGDNDVEADVNTNVDYDSAFDTDVDTNTGSDLKKDTDAKNGKEGSGSLYIWLICGAPIVVGTVVAIVIIRRKKIGKS